MLRSKKGFTILELITTVGILGFLMVSITFVYSTCIKAYNAGQDRSKVRTQLSQAMELMTKELIKATAITTCNENTLTFTADLGTNSQLAYTYELYSSNDLFKNDGTTPGPYEATGHNYLSNTTAPSGPYNLLTRLDSDGFGNGSTKASGIESPTTAGHPIFSCSNGQVTIDVTAVNYGETVHMQTQVRPRNMPTGLVGWWKFDDAPGSTTAADSSGNGNNGDLTGHSPTLHDAGPIGTSYAFTFNGTDQYINIPDSSALKPISALSISVWCKNITNYASEMIFDYSHNNTFINYGYQFALAWNHLSYLQYSNGGYKSVTGSSVLSDNTWYFLTAVYDGSHILLYVNGTLDGSDTASGSISYGTVTGIIGMIPSHNVATAFKGSIDDLRIYSRALTAAEVSEIYNQGMGNLI